MEDNRAKSGISEMKKPSINKQVREFGINRLRKLGYNEKDCRSILAKSFRELCEAWKSHYGKVQ